MSHKFDPAEGENSLKYHLPATELVITATYTLTCQSLDEDDRTIKEPAKIALTALELKPQPVADPEHAYVIDSSRLSNLTTSVSPAKFEFQNGILRGLTFKPKSEIRETVGELTRIAANVAPLAALVVVAPVEPSEALRCDAILLEDAAKLAQARKAIGDRQDVLAKADANLQADPNEARTFAVANAERRLSEARLAFAAMRADSFQRTVEISVIPRRTEAAKPTERFTIKIDPASKKPFERWTEHLSGGPVNKLDLFTLIATVEGIGSAGRSAPEPGGSGYPGVYYRRAATGTVTINHPTSGFDKRVERVPLLHLGEVARLELKNRAFENRGFTLAFDETGQLTSYEVTTTAAANELLGTAADLPQTIADAERAQLQREADLLKAKKDLLDARKALEEAQSGNGEN